MRHGTVAASAGILFFYLFLQPELDVLSGVILFGIWGAAMMWDLQVTFANRSYIQRHEQSILLLFAYKRFSIRCAIAFVLVMETVCVIGLPVMITFDLSTASFAVAYVFSLLHVLGAKKNEEFVKKYSMRS